MNENKRIFIEGKEVNIHFDNYIDKNEFPDSLGSIHINFLTPVQNV